MFMRWSQSRKGMANMTPKTQRKPYIPPALDTAQIVRKCTAMTDAELMGYAFFYPASYELYLKALKDEKEGICQ